MRNYFFAFKESSVFSFSASTPIEKLYNELWIRFGNSLPYDPRLLTPSEQEVIDNLTSWYNILRLNERTSRVAKVVHPVFVYHNINDGKAVLFFWNDDLAEYDSEIAAYRVLR